MPSPATPEDRPETGIWLPAAEPRRSLGRDDALPPAPYAVSLYRSPGGWEWPYTIRSMTTGQALAGHIDCRAAADAIAAALNAAAARGVLGIEG